MDVRPITIVNSDISINVQTATHKTTLTNPLFFSDPLRMRESISVAEMDTGAKSKMAGNFSVIVDVCVRASRGSIDPGGFVRVYHPLQKCAVATVIDFRLSNNNKKKGTFEKDSFSCGRIRKQHN
jgi:hypothetical protein